MGGADRPREQPADAELHSAQPVADPRPAEDRRLPGQADVGPQGEAHPAAVGGAFDGGQDRLGEVPEGGDHAAHVGHGPQPEPVATQAVGPRRQTGVLELQPRAEGPPGAGEDHHPAVVVGGDLVEGGVELGHQGEGEGVEAFRVVQGHPTDLGGDGVGGDERHGDSLTDRRPCATVAVALAVGHDAEVRSESENAFDPYGGAPEPEVLTAHLLVATPRLEPTRTSPAGRCWCSTMATTGRSAWCSTLPAASRCVEVLPQWHPLAVAARRALPGRPGGPERRHRSGPAPAPAPRRAGRSGSRRTGWQLLIDDPRPVGTFDLEAGPGPLAEQVVGVRLFSGYAGWGPGQLEAEVAEGSWFVVRGGGPRSGVGRPRGAVAAGAAPPGRVAGRGVGLPARSRGQLSGLPATIRVRATAPRRTHRAEGHRRRRPGGRRHAGPGVRRRSGLQLLLHR